MSDERGSRAFDALREDLVKAQRMLGWQDTRILYLEARIEKARKVLASYPRDNASSVRDICADALDALGVQ